MNTANTGAASEYVLHQWERGPARMRWLLAQQRVDNVINIKIYIKKISYYSAKLEFACVDTFSYGRGRRRAKSNKLNKSVYTNRTALVNVLSHSTD